MSMPTAYARGQLEGCTVKKVITAILGGGQGTRLWPLTEHRAKPAVPVGGKFRLIDIPISNSLHGGIDRIYVMTQFNTASLHRHIAQTYRFDVFSSGFVNILAAEQSLENRDWYQGTADAVRQNLRRLTESQPSDVLILSGDQLYLMDIQTMLRQHRANDADITIAVKPVPPDQAKGLGILKLDSTGRLVEFVEKPKDPDVIRSLALDSLTINNANLSAQPGELLASMGIYMFRRGTLKRHLEGSEATDFGREIIPQAVKTDQVFGFVHNGYWRDIGTIPAFHEANLELTQPLPPLNLYDRNRPIYTHARFLPGCKIDDCSIYQSIVNDGAIISGSRVNRSIIGLCSLIQSGTEIEESVIMGANEFGRSWKSGVAAGIGHGCRIRRAIVDRDVRIGDGSRLLNEAGVQEADGEFYCIRDGIIVVPRAAVIPPGTVI